MSFNFPSLKSIEAFESAGRLKSFKAASQELNLSESTISYRIEKLENELGTLLFERQIRKIVLTNEGRSFLKDASKSLSLFKAAVIKAKNKAESSLTVATSTYFASRWLSPRMQHWARLTNNSVNINLSHDLEIETSEPIIKIVWRINIPQPNIPSLLLETDMSVYCSPKIAKFLKDPRDIQDFNLLSHVPHLDVWDDWLSLVGQKRNPAKIVVMPDSNVRIQAAVDGLGLVMGNQLIQKEIIAGKLVKPFSTDLKGCGFYIENPNNVSNTAKKFIAWLKQASRKK